MRGVVIASSGTMWMLLCVMMGLGLQMGAAFESDGQPWSDAEQNLTNITSTVESNMTASAADSGGPVSESITSTVVFYVDWAVGVAELSAMYGYRWPVIGQYLALPVYVAGPVLPLYNAYQRVTSEL